jgi:hypothetical protein
MSSLSNVLSQYNQRKEQIQINNEPYKLFSNQHLFACFAHTVGEKGKQLNNSRIDSLKITRIEHYLNLIAKDLLDKFQIVHIKFSNLSSFFSSNLFAHGFKLSDELTVQYGLITSTSFDIEFFFKIFCFQVDILGKYLHPNLVLNVIKEASSLIFERKFVEKNAQNSENIEQNALLTCLSNAILPRLDLNSALMVINSLKLKQPDLELAHRHQLSIENGSHL